ncbi:MAG: polyprenyl synthetase family protein [Clostridia bacterium]|nr:polyprenyl synthetase family protein [Clostridia bacterium]
MMKNDFIGKYSKITEDALKRYIPESDAPQKRLYDAMGYSLFAGGKRLRPMIMMMTAKMFGKPAERVLPFACALEMIHTYSLIHDDLPAMDNDDLRRGKQTNHKVFGEAAAILAGDALLTKAFEAAAGYSEAAVAKDRVLRAIRVLAISAGSEGMVGGQDIDIHGDLSDTEKLKFMHSLKTGALIRAAGVIGAILSDAGEKDIEAVDKYCLNLGIAFQIQDDILDVLGNEQSLGKPIGSDADNNKSTYVTLCGIEKSQKMQAEYIEKAKESLNGFPNSTELLALADMLITRKV